MARIKTNEYHFRIVRTSLIRVIGVIRGLISFRELNWKPASSPRPETAVFKRLFCRKFTEVPEDSRGIMQEAFLAPGFRADRYQPDVLVAARQV